MLLVAKFCNETTPKALLLVIIYKEIALAFRATDPSQIILFATTLDERIPKDAKCRFIVKLVQKLDLRPLYSRYSNLGTSALDPSALLATWFLAYSEGITSSRTVEFLCRDSQQFIYTSGDTRPDHATLCRFRQQDEELFAAYFLQIIQMAQQEGLISLTKIHIDGTKMEASASRKQSKTLEELDSLIAQVQQDIEKYMEQCNTTDTIEDSDTVCASDDLKKIHQQIEKLDKEKAKLLQRKQQVQERQKTLKKEHQKNHKINITDPDSRHMDNVNGKRTEPAYNAQACVEEKNQFIVACEVITDTNDQNQLLNQIENVEKNFGVDDQRQYTFDAGYHSKEQLKKLEDKPRDVVVADPTPHNRSVKSTPTPIDDILKQQRRVQRSDFVFHSQGDYYQCPADNKLEYIRNYEHGRLYQRLGCQSCSLAPYCLAEDNTSGIKRIYRHEYEYLAEKMAEKLKTQDAKGRLKKRRCTPEVVFATLKQNMGFRRFNLRGHKKVKTEWLIMCIAYNINKFYQLSAQNGLGSNPTDPNFAKIFDSFIRILILLSIIRYYRVILKSRPLNYAGVI